MITDMRDSISSWPVRIILILIILSFVSFYGWRSGENNLKTGEIAQVNGETITTRDFAFQYQNLIQNYKKQGQLSDDIPENLQNMIKQQLLTSMIYQKLKSSEAVRAGLVASDEKTKSMIKKQFSSSDDKFDFKFYENFLRNQLGKTPGQYEEEMRSNLRSELFEKLILETSLSSNLQLKDSYKQTNEKVALTFVKLNEKNTESFRPKAKTPSDEELKKYYTDHNEQFKTKEKRKLDISFFEKSSFEKSPNFSKEAEGLLQDADAAKKDPRLVHIETGLIGYEDHVAPLSSGELTEVLNSTQNLDAGKSTVLTSRDGKKVFLTKLVEIQAAKLPELASIKSQVEKAYVENENATSFDAWIQNTSANIAKGTLTLDALAKKAGTSVKNTDSFAYSSANMIPELGMSEEVMTGAFKMKDKEFFSKPVKIGNDYAFVQVKSKIEPDWKKFETDQDSLANVLHQQSSQARFVAWMTAVEKKSKIKQEVASPQQSGPIDEE